MPYFYRARPCSDLLHVFIHLKHVTTQEGRFCNHHPHFRNAETEAQGLENELGLYGIKVWGWNMNPGKPASECVPRVRGLLLVT